MFFITIDINRFYMNELTYRFLPNWYNSPVEKNYCIFKINQHDGVKNRVNFVANDAWDTYAIAYKECHAEKGWLERFKENINTCLFGYMRVNLENGSRILIHKQEAIDRLKLDEKKLNEAIKSDSVADIIREKVKTIDLNKEQPAIKTKFNWKTNLSIAEHQFLGAHNVCISREGTTFWDIQQNWSLRRLLNAGVRAIELDVAGHPNTGELHICHGYYRRFEFVKTPPITLKNTKHVKKS